MIWLKTHYHWFLSFMVLLTATIYFLIQNNKEFLIYAATLVVFIGILAVADTKFRFLTTAKWGFLIWMIMHMAGGSIYVGSTRLYDLILIPIIGKPYNVLKYDQVVHFFCYVVFTPLMYSVLKSIARTRFNRLTFSFVLVMAASAIGGLNEIIEFSAVVMYDSTGVGGYTNTCIDLIANLMGAITGALLIQPRLKNQS